MTDPDAGTIGAWLRDHAEKAPDKIALEFEDGRSWSYAELDRWADGIAHLLQHDHGIEHGDRVAFLGLNHPSMIALLFACARLGAILVPLNWRLAPAELSFIVQDCAPKVLYAGDAFTDVARNVVGEVSGCFAQAVADLETAGVDVADQEQSGCLTDPVLIVYTSGTTGRPKGVVLTQEALQTNAIGSVDLHRFTPDDRVLVVLPLFHVGGLNISLTPALFAGATVMLHARFDPQQTLTAIETWRPQVLVLVPATMSALMKLPAWPQADTTSLRMLTTGSMVVPMDLVAAYEAKGISVVQVYGSTETCPVAAYTQPGDGQTNPHTTGKAGCRSEVRIVDDAGVVVGVPNVDGEIEVRGAHIMQGYWNRPGETAAAFNGDWYRTGDIGALDADGNLYFRERVKHMIVSGGENIYPAEIERVINSVPEIAEVAVCGIPDDQWGEVPAAGVVLTGDNEEAAMSRIRQALDDELARFKHPKRVVFLDNLPRNAMAKVVRDDLRSILVGE